MKQTLPSVLNTLLSKSITFNKSIVLFVMLLLISGNVVGQTTQTFSYTGANQTFTVPTGVTSITITASGAAGGGTGSTASKGGKGAVITGAFTVIPGHILNIIVGQLPTSAGSYGGGGGGGTYVWNSTTSTLLIVGGGGGGGSYNAIAGKDASVTTTPTATASGGAAGGSTTLGGSAMSGEGGGGAGWTGNGATATSGGGGGLAPPTSTGGTKKSSGTNGGFGGGGGGAANGGGGGGGYAGGGGGIASVGGGGGSSYNTGTSPSTSVTNTGAGSVAITYTLPVCTAPTSLAASATSSAYTTTTISGSFTAATSAPSGYIVVRSTSAVAPTTLALATALPTVGNITAFGASTYVEYVGTAAGSWTSTTLSPGTTYYYYVFSYNNTSCSGGPAYSSSATSFNQSTVSCPATSLTGLSYSSSPVSYCLSSAITQNSATLATTAGNVTYSVSPALPTGLSISASTGAITGTPTAAVAAANYTVTANNGCTSTTATVNIATLALPTTPVSSAATSLGLTGFTANWGTVSGATSYLLDVSTSSSFTSFVNGFNGLNVANVLTYAVTGLSSGTTYYYRVRASNGSCVSSSSSTITQATPTINGGALQETFPTANSGAVPSGWSTSGWSIGASATLGYPGNLANAIYKNLYSSATTGTFTTAIVGPLLPNANFTYDYALYDYGTTTATTTGWGSFQIQISTDFGTTWSNLGAAVTANTPSGYINKSLSLSAYAGQYVQFKINATWTAGDYYLSFDNFNAIGPCPTPTAPTALVQGATGPGSIAESFTPNGTAPDGYMVVRYPAGSLVTAPTNGTTTYAVNQTLGLGTISNIVSGASTSFALSGLTPNTAYDIYVYPYTNVSCIGAAVFGTALSGTHSTGVCPAIPSTISVGATGDYTSLSALSLILNGCDISNPILVELQSNYNPANESLPIVFNNNTGSSAINTVTIRPAAGAGPFAISGSSTSALLDLNGARYFTFDGRAGGLGTSVLSVTNSGNGAALRLINDAQNNTVQYITLKASNTSATNGVVRITSAAGSTLANGNNNNTISNCNIDGNATSPVGIYMLGSAAPADNKSNTISSNNIYDYYSNDTGSNNAGILLLGNNGVTIGSATAISGNSFYQTAPRTYSTTGSISAIGGVSSANGAVNITNNKIGGTAPNNGGSSQILNGTSTYSFRPIYVATAGPDASSISNNTIANLTVTTASVSTTTNNLIYALTNGNNSVNITNNTIGSTTVPGSITFSSGSGATLNGIAVGTVGITSVTHNATTINTTGNTISGINITGSNACNFNGINYSTVITFSGVNTISNNIVGSVGGSITNGTTGNVFGIINANPIGSNVSNNTISYLTSTATSTSSQLVGISTTSGPNVIGGSGSNGNTITNFTSSAANTGTTTSASIIGISQTATTAGQVVKNNKVSLLSNTGTAAASVNGIYFSGPTTGTNEVSGNLVHTLSSSTAASTINGLQIADSGNATIYNNILRLGLDSSGADVTNNIILNGINQSSTTSNHGVYFNTVYIAGANVGAGTNTTFAITSTATSGTRAIRNNIFSNLRANGTGTGKHYSIKVSGLTGLTINNNDYWTGSTTALLALNNTTDATTFSAFQTATSQDGGSISVSPGFITANASAASFNLGITGGVSSALESGGAIISGITTDYAGDTRPGPVGSTNGGGAAPDMGADEFDGIPGYTCATLSGLTALTTNATVCNNSAVLSISGAINGTGITYQWQVASSQLGTYSNITSATSSTYTVPVTTVSSNWYQCIVTCINGPVSATATAVNVVVQGCNYAVTRNTNVTYNSIITTGTGSTYSTLSNTDDGYTNYVTLTGTTFKYRNQPVTRFYSTTNGTMSFSATQTTSSSTLASAYGNLDLSTAGNDLMLAPYFADLVIKGNLAANKDASMRYKIFGTLGSGTADIVIEWAEMEGYGFGNPNLNFQVVLHENGNTIEYNYGNMLKFDGAANSTGTFATVCAIGLNATTPATADLSQRLILQNANSTNFGTTSVRNLLQTPDCYSQLLFTPAATYSGGAAPATVPTNNELAGAINLSVNNAPCISNCGNSYYSSGATASAGTTVCSATLPGTADDDVWFTFTPSTSTANHKIVLTPTFAYDAVLQLIDVTSNTVVQCVNSATAGLSETISSVTLDQSHQYALRVYDAGTGAAGGGEFSICVSEIIPPPTNDDPTGATELTVGTSCSGTASEYPATLAATATSGITVCSATTAGTPDDDVWYKFTTNSNSGITYTLTATGVSTYNAVLQLFSGTPSSLTSVDCVNATSNGSAETITSSSLTASTTYYLRVYHSGIGYATGNFNICVYVTPPACVTLPTAPTNNSSVCASASGTTLSWASVSNAAKYDVYLDDTSGSSSVAVSSDQAATSYTTPSALAAGTYTWRIVPKNDYGAATSCSNFTFTVSPTNTVSTASTTPSLCINTALTNITHATIGATGIGAPIGLPAGVTAAWASNTITISGTPSASGTFNYTIPLTGGCGSVSALGTVTVTAANTTGTASTNPTLCINATLTDITRTTTGATGIGTPTGLPAGITAAWASNTITISGAPTESGVFSYTIPLTGGCGSVNATGTITVNPILTASVAITASPSGAICPGTSIRFTASPTNGGSSPSYQWKVNGTAVSGEISSTFTTTTLANSDVVTVVMASNATPCLEGSPATSNSITMTVNPNPIVLVLTGSTTCTGNTGSITSSTSVTGVNYQLYNSSNVAVGSVVPGTDSSLTWSSIAIGSGYYVKGTNTTTTCVSSNSNSVAVGENTLPTALVLTGYSACAGSMGSITSSTSVSGINYQLYDASNATVGSALVGTGSGLTWSSIAIGTGYYAIGTNATTTCVSANSTVVTVSTITDKTWTGGSGNWNNTANWSCNSLPSPSDTIIISSGNPVLDTDFTIGSSGSLTISGSGTLTINSTKTLTITGTANFGGNSVTIKSDSNGTGAIGQVTGTNLTGATNVTVERYIPNKRAWRALTAPLKGSNASIFSQWQNNGTVIPNTGVEIWGPAGTGSAGNGLAVGPSNSMLQYVAGAWTAVTNTTTTNLFTTNSNNAFMVFPTGGYGSGLISSAATPVATTVKATGQLITGSVNYTALPSASHTLIGNPYASPLDIATMLGANTGFSGYVWVWDANLVGDYSVGAYNLFDSSVGASGNYSNLTDNTGISGAQIQSGQAFFVKPTTNLLTFTIQEAHKGSAFSNAVFRNATSAEVLRVGLYKQTNNQWSGRDGAMAVFLSDAEANPTSNKMANGTENVAFTKNGILFASEHHLPLVASDVLNVRVWNTTAGANYKLKINTEQFTTTNLNATLEDVFTNSRTTIALDGTAVEYPFAVTSEAASTGNRFRIVFENNALGINNPKVSGITILPNPITGDVFQVNLGTLGIGTYAYTISNALGQEVEKGSINNTTQNTSYTVKFKNATAAGMYIMKVTGSDNSVFTAKLIKK